jgi:hypothetical protein
MHLSVQIMHARKNFHKTFSKIDDLIYRLISFNHSNGMHS